MRMILETAGSPAIHITNAGWILTVSSMFTTSRKIVGSFRMSRCRHRDGFFLFARASAENKLRFDLARFARSEFGLAQGSGRCSRKRA